MGALANPGAPCPPANKHNNFCFPSLFSTATYVHNESGWSTPPPCRLFWPPCNWLYYLPKLLNELRWLHLGRSRTLSSALYYLISVPWPNMFPCDTWLQMAFSILYHSNTNFDSIHLHLLQNTNLQATFKTTNPFATIQLQNVTIKKLFS